jgi:hypothetical protein
MGAEIENSLESAIGVGLPPTSLMRARTVGQIAALIAGHMGGAAVQTPAVEPPLAEPSPADEIDVDALSNEEIDKLLEGQADGHEGLEIHAARPETMSEVEVSPCLKTDERV